MASFFVVLLLTVLVALQLNCATGSRETVRVMNQLLSLSSGGYIAVTALEDVHAMGGMRNPRTLFYPRYNRATGTLAFQSVCFPDKFLIFHNKTLLKLGTPTGGNEQFVERQLYYGRVFRSYVFNKPECFMAFDHVGNVHTDQLCKVMLNQSDFLVHRLVGRLTDPCRPRSTTEL